MTKDSFGLITRNERAIAYRSSLAPLGCSKGKNMSRPSALSLADVRQIAQKYTSRSEFAKHDGKAYQFAWRNKLLDDVCSHMQISSIYSDARWCHETSTLEAKKHTSRAAFKRGNSGAYCYALNNGILDEICSHMPVLKKTWNEKNIRLEAAKYANKLDFKKYNTTAYRCACQQGILESVCLHMDSKQRWSKAKVLLESAKYANKSAFRANSGGAYNHALLNGYLNEACAHMQPGKYGFDPDKPASLYCMKITNQDGRAFFKVGITNRAAERRAMGLGAKTRNTVEIINELRFERGSQARNVERAIHTQYASLKYRGAPIMNNGNKEVFVEDVFAMFNQTTA